MPKTTIYIDSTAAAIDFWDYYSQKALTEMPMNYIRANRFGKFPQELEIDILTLVSAVAIKLRYS